MPAADLLPTSPREAQGRKALEGKPRLKVTFNFFFNCLWEIRKRVFKAGSSQRLRFSELVGAPFTLGMEVDNREKKRQPLSWLEGRVLGSG